MKKNVKIIYVIGLLAVFSFVARAQEAIISLDSLNNWVAANLKSINDTAVIYQKAHRALYLSIKEKNPDAMIKAWHSLSIYHENYGSIDSSIYYMEVLRDYYAENADTASLANAYLEISILYDAQAGYADAMQQVFAALALYEATGDQKGIAKCYTNICDLLYYEDKYAESVEYCNKAIVIQQKIDAEIDLATSYRFKASSLLFMDGELENALSTINKAIEIFEKYEDRQYSQMACINGRGNILKYMGRYDEAIADYTSNYEKSIAMGIERYTIPSLGNIGHVYVMQGKYREALPYNLEAIEIMKRSGETKNLWENYMHVSDIYANIGDYQNAYDYNKLYSDAYAAYLSTIIDRLESEAQIKYETAKKDEMISSQENTIANQRKIQILYISIGLLLLASLAGMIQSRIRIRRKQRLIETSKAKLQESLENLKATQSQLIHAEKMASLGELTAGIAHEIQNPLNFVNNFSEVNSELIDELSEELEKGNFEEVNAITKDIKENELKINHHGKRADAIVKGMLQHSRANTGQKEPTDINALADEYLRLAFHGLRAKDKSFNADFSFKSDDSLPKINVVAQDIGRVLLNLINNAFYTVAEKAKQNVEGYKPMVIVSTKNLDEKIEIRVKDNGNGITEEVKDKIFQPFFTTKPTGQGTGLGLSMSYDIITKGHGGNLTMETKNGQGTTFIIHIPV